MRLFFHLVNSHDTIPDLEGVEVDDLSRAWTEIERAIEEMRDAGEDVGRSGWMLSVTDAAGRVFLTLDLSSSMPALGRKQKPSLSRKN